MTNERTELLIQKIELMQELLQAYVAGTGMKDILIQLANLSRIAEGQMKINRLLLKLHGMTEAEIGEAIDRFLTPGDN